MPAERISRLVLAPTALDAACSSVGNAAVDLLYGGGLNRCSSASSSASGASIAGPARRPSDDFSWVSTDGPTPPPLDSCEGDAETTPKSYGTWSPPSAAQLTPSLSACGSHTACGESASGERPPVSLCPPVPPLPTLLPLVLPPAVFGGAPASPLLAALRYRSSLSRRVVACGQPGQSMLAGDEAATDAAATLVNHLRIGGAYAVDAGCKLALVARAAAAASAAAVGVTETTTTCGEVSAYEAVIKSRGCEAAMVSLLELRPATGAQAGSWAGVADFTLWSARPPLGTGATPWVATHLIAPPSTPTPALIEAVAAATSYGCTVVALAALCGPAGAVVLAAMPRLIPALVAHVMTASAPAVASAVALGALATHGGADMGEAIIAHGAPAALATLLACGTADGTAAAAESLCALHAAVTPGAVIPHHNAVWGGTPTRGGAAVVAAALTCPQSVGALVAMLAGPDAPGRVAASSALTRGLTHAAPQSAAHVASSLLHLVVGGDKTTAGMPDAGAVAAAKVMVDGADAPAVAAVASRLTTCLATWVLTGHHGVASTGGDLLSSLGRCRVLRPAVISALVSLLDGSPPAAVAATAARSLGRLAVLPGPSVKDDMRAAVPVLVTLLRLPSRDEDMSPTDREARHNAAAHAVVALKRSTIHGPSRAAMVAAGATCELETLVASLTSGDTTTAGVQPWRGLGDSPASGPRSQTGTMRELLARCDEAHARSRAVDGGDGVDLTRAAISLHHYLRSFGGRGTSLDGRGVPDEAAVARNVRASVDTTRPATF